MMEVTTCRLLMAFAFIKWVKHVERHASIVVLELQAVDFYVNKDIFDVIDW